MKLYTRFLVVLFFSILTTLCTYASDSLRTEIINGKKVIVHKVEQGQTLYSIARKYSVSVDAIKQLNPDITQIKTNSELYIPFKQEHINSAAVAPAPIKEEKRGTDEDQDQLVHKVMPGETLYKISKIYNVSVAKINEANQLGTKGIKTGQELIIPDAGAGSQTAVKQTPSKEASFLPQPIKSEKKTSLTGYPSITESGTAKLDESMLTDSYQVQHKTAKIGTLILLKNKETGLVAHAKVTGTSTGQELVVINKKVYEKLEGKSKNIQVEVFYTPED